MVRFYQKYLSSAKGYSSCKYYPTCSCYAVEAIERFGALKGTGLAIWRVLRCNPFSQGGGLLIALTAAPNSSATRHLVVIVYGVDYQGI